MILSPEGGYGPRIGAFALGALAAALISSPAAALAADNGTHFVLELTTGLGESAFLHATPGLTAGAAFGTSFKLKILPMRWYILANVSGRNAWAAGTREGIEFSVDRREIDLFLSQRVVMPVYGYFRLYGELGLGQRFSSQSVRRGAGLGSLSESSHDLLLVLAVGAEARFHKHFSIGLRGEMTPLDDGVDLATATALLYPTQNRLTLLAQLGFHF